MIKMRKLVFILYFSTLFTINSLGSPNAEELLIKEELRYLGWQASKENFKTCSKKIMEIGDGTIEATNEKCPEDSRIRPAMTIGTVLTVDVWRQTLEIKDNKGQLQSYFFRAMDERKTNEVLKSIKPGDKVTVISPVPGRAEAITIQRYR